MNLEQVPALEASAPETDDTGVMFRAAVDTVGLGVWIHDLATGRISSSPKMRALAGFAPGDEVADLAAWGARIHPEDLPGLSDQYTQVMAAGLPNGEVPYSCAYRNLLPDGRIVHVQYFGRMLFDGAGKPLRVVGTAYDTTEQTLTLAALRASEENYRSLVELSPDAIMVHEGGIIALANPAAVRLFGAASAQELIGGSIYQRIVPEHRERARLRVAAIEREGTPSPLALQRWLRLNGTVLEVEVTGALLSRGVRAAVQVILRDVAERRRAEILLREREAFFRALIEHSLDLVLLVDGQSAVSYASPSVEKVLGLSPDALVGRPLAELAAPDDRGLLATELAAATASPGSVRRVELRLGSLAAGFREVEVRVSDRSADPAVRALVFNVRDISERRALEAQLLQSQKLEAVGRLAGGVAHDFNNLLCVILGCSEAVLAEIDANESVHEDLREISRSAERAAALTRQLLAYSRKQVLRPVLLDLNQVLEGMGHLLRRLLGEDLRLEIELRPEGAPIRADPGQLEQVVVNLAVNARDAMPDGGVLRLSTGLVALEADAARERGLPEGCYSVLTARDTGQGMDAETLAHLFEPFFTTKQPGAGTGLGLATVYGIVRQSGGTILVESAPGAGSTFSVYLPSPERAVPRTAAAPPSAEIAGRESLLLVEDSEPLRLLLRRRLAALGYRVHAAASGPEALAWLDAQREPIDALVTDGVMPGMSGPALIGQVQRRSPGAKILLISGYLEVTGAAGAIAAGAAYLPKPFTPDRLAARLRELFETGR